MIKRQAGSISRIGKRAVSLGLAAMLAVGMLPGAEVHASETKVDGNAPFMNNWLVSGPFTEKVIDNIYGMSDSGGGDAVSPEFNQTEMVFGIGKTGSLKRGTAEHLWTDGHVNTFWQSNVATGINSTVFRMELEYPADVTSLQLYGYYEESETPETDHFSVQYQVKNSSGTVLAEGTVKELTNGASESDMRAVSFPKVLNGVTLIEFTMDTTAETNGHAGTGKYYGMREVFVYGMPPAAPDLSERGIGAIGGLKASASSENGENKAGLALDHDDTTAWKSDTVPGQGGKWDNFPALTLTLPMPKIVTSISLKGYESSGTHKFAVQYQMLDEAGEILAGGTKYNVTGAEDDKQVIGLNYGVTGVKTVKLTIDPANGGDSEPDKNKDGLFGLRTVELWGADEAVHSEELVYGSLRVSSAEGQNKAENAFDGNPATMWRCDNRSGVTFDSRPTMEISLKESSRLDSLSFLFYEEFPVDGMSRHVSCQLYDAGGRLVYSGGLMAENEQESKYDFGIGAADIKTIKLLINPSGIVNGSDKLGFREISMKGAGMEEEGSEALGDISPVLGEKLEDPSTGEAFEWLYFDDRVFNRNKDDYNDIMGLYDVKRGEDTMDKFVAAATYVYSDKEQHVDWQFAGSGKYNLYCNDFPAGEQAGVPGDVRKTGTRYGISLKEGWNKLLVQIQHVNPNIACNLMGFYSRLCDAAGNTVSGLTYSVSGPHTAGLEIVTQGLDIDRKAFEERNAECTANEYPENTLPYAYEKNPYVLLSAAGGGDKGQASRFGFQAGGGKPGYTWKLTEGALPGGLILNEDGTVSGTVEEGAAANSTRDYTFTLQVTDAEGETAEKEFVMTAKPHPAQWFEEGRMSALSHCTGTIPNLYDPNYNYDEWAQTAKEMGMTMLSTESFQNSIYYWPSPNADRNPSDSNRQYKYGGLYQDKDGNWEVIDRVMQAKEAAERYGLHFGTYLSPQRPQSDIQGLVERYDPWYIFVDGNPQTGVNLDIAFSSARNYNDRVLFQTNPSKEIADQDLTLMERPYWFSQPYVDTSWQGNIDINNNPEGNYLVHEEWNDPFSTALDLWKVWSPGNNMRDSWPAATKELIDAIGHGYVMNHDVSIAASRGCDNLNWGGEIRTSMDKDNIYMMIPIDSQQMSSMRIPMGKWLANEGRPSLYESLFGTMPYYIEYTPKAGWHKPGTQQASLFGEGPEWGYSLSRDQYVYLHMIENPIGNGRNKAGFTGQDKMEGIGPFAYEVESVSWLNEGRELNYTQAERDGSYYIDIDTSIVTADPIDTIIKIVTKDPVRNYAMTDVHVFSSQSKAGELNLRSECYMNNYTSVLAPADVKYAITNTNVAMVGANGQGCTVYATGEGEADIIVTATYNDGINAPQVIEERYPVKVSDGRISPDLALTGIGMFTNGNAFWDEVFAGTQVPVNFKGYTEYGGTVDLLEGVNAADITYHYAKANGSTDNQFTTDKIEITEVAKGEVPFVVEDGLLKLDPVVGADKYYCYWADINVDGKTYTTSRNYITLMPDRNLAEGIVPRVTSGNGAMLSDGIINDSTGGNLARWTADAADADPSITYDLGSMQALTRVNLFYNWCVPHADAVTYSNAPNQVIIEYSLDGDGWKTGNTITKQTGKRQPTVDSYNELPANNQTLYAWEAENLFYNYPVDSAQEKVNARYVRITFPGGGQDGSPLDLLEVRIFGTGVQKYSVKAGETENGSVALDKTQAAAGETVTASVSSGDGYQFVEGSLKVNDGQIPVEKTEEGTFTFTMPGEDVIVTAQFELIPEEVEKYSITVSSNDAMGTIIPDKTEAEEGEEIALTVSSGDGCRLVEGSLQANEGRVPIKDGRFKMPPEDVLVTAEFEAIPPSVYTVEIAAVENGSIWADPMSGSPGTSIQLTVTPDTGYRIMEGSLKATMADGTEAEVTDEFVFLMPEGNVTVTAVFEKVPVDYSGLQEVYDRYKDLTQGSYSDSSWKEFMLKKSAAEAVLANPDAAQPEVDSAKADLEAAYSNLQEEPSTGNIYRDLLRKTCSYAEGLSTEGVVDTAVKCFQAALCKAKSLLDNQEATDAALEEAFNELLDGIWGLGLTKGDKTTLELLIARAELMAADQDKYVAAQWQLLLDKLAKAKEVMADGDAMEEDIRPAADELLDAVLKQRFKARKDILQDILNKAEAVDESLYTDESLLGFRAAFDYAREIMKDDTLSEEDQPTVDKAAADLNQAILDLVKKDDTDPGNPTDPSSPTDPSDPTDPSSPTEPDDPSGSDDPADPDEPDVPSGDGIRPSADESSNTPENGSGTIDSPKTDDYSNLGTALSVTALGIVCVGFAAVRRRKRED